MTGQELALRQSSVPVALIEAGYVSVDEGHGVQRVTVTDTARAKMNVLSPREVLEQADPLWRPAVRAVKLDTENGANLPSQENKHWYMEQGKPALRKTGLLELMKLAGIEIVKTERMARALLRETEIGWTAYARVRQSDGTWMTLPPASKVIDEIREHDAAFAAAKNKNGFDQRWMREVQHLDAKCETKAILRCIRAALSIPGTFDPQSWKKPFLVIAYNFTPDYSDAEVRRMLTAAGASASTDVYGSSEVESHLDTGAFADEIPAPSEPYIDVEPIEDDEPPAEPEPAPVDSAQTAGDHVVTWSNALKGQRIRDLSEHHLNWLLNHPATKLEQTESRDYARAYRQSLPIEGEVQ